MAPSGRWAVALHGGAGTISRNTDPLPYETALTASMNAAISVLERKRHGAEWELHSVPEPSLALAAALAAVESMEDCDLFNAGRGAVFNDEGFIENEAAVMDGGTLRSGAVCGCFKSAEAFADKYGTLIVRQPTEWFETGRRRNALERSLAQGKKAELDHSGGTVESKTKGKYGTVGAAVCDGNGGVAVVTSTGGQTCKMAGRIGDTPVIGAGSYADNNTLALSGTGNGEHFLRFAAAARVSCAMQYGGMSASDALDGVVNNEMPNDTGGFVAVTPQGESIARFNSLGMFRALRDAKGKDIISIWED